MIFRRTLSAVCAVALLASSACGSLPFGGTQPAASPSPSAQAGGGFQRGQGGQGGQAGQGGQRRAAASAVPSPSPAVAATGLAALGATLSGEYAVTANLDDRSLSVIPIGQARAVANVPLDIAPSSSVAAMATSDRVYVSDQASGSHTLAQVSLSSASQTGRVDAGDTVDRIVSPPGAATGPLLVLTAGDNTLRSL
ncbi:MAG: hypothetical protein JOZ81_19140, partial [Chloroflexi bacterium]|nr:hypothetical protein [Chloroflexota bacterium]